MTIRHPVLAAAAGAALFVLSLGAGAQTSPSTTTSTTTPTGATTGTTSTTGTTATTPTPPAPTLSPSTEKYLAGKGAQFEVMAGSHENLVSLVNGLRTGTTITLSGATPTSTGGTTGTSASFDPPTRPMGYGNITRALSLAQRALAADGITNPTSTQLRAALMGGTVTTANGSAQLQGVLQLRAQGMGWGKIAHTIGVFPGGGASAKAHAPIQPGTSTGQSGITTAAGGRFGGTSSNGNGARGGGIVTAAGTASAAASGGLQHAGARSNGYGNAYGHAGK